jgi:hypothetical protein
MIHFCIFYWEHANFCILKKKRMFMCSLSRCSIFPVHIFFSLFCLSSYFLAKKRCLRKISTLQNYFVRMLFFYGHAPCHHTCLLFVATSSARSTHNESSVLCTLVRGSGDSSDVKVGDRLDEGSVRKDENTLGMNSGAGCWSKCRIDFIISDNTRISWEWYAFTHPVYVHSLTNSLRGCSFTQMWHDKICWLGNYVTSNFISIRLSI